MASGIPKSAIEFFTELEDNNNKTWWAANKERYLRDVRGPFETVLGDLGDQYQPWRIYRPHRDTRFATDKTPYKNFIGAVSQLALGNGCFVQISSRGLLLGSGYPMMAPDQLATFRRAIADESTGARFVKLLIESEKAGLHITGGRYEPLKRNPKGYEPDHPRGTWLRWKGVEIPQRLGAPAWLSSKNAADKIRLLLQEGDSVTSWLDAHVGPSLLTPEEIWSR
jgi:uncharacterized protein (TIGR02453 family)